MFLLAIVAFLAALTWPIQSVAYILPAFILVLTAFLLLTHVVLNLLQSTPGGQPVHKDPVASAMAWVLSMPLLAALLGFVAGASVYVLIYFRFNCRESWVFAVSAMVAVGIALGLLATALEMSQLFDALLWRYWPLGG